MAAEEDVELRDLVAHTLETRGVLGKIRVSMLNAVAVAKCHRAWVFYVLKAQLRASVFLALEEQESQEVS